ncbi:MAG: PDZ domain-containing protein, partial [Opitutales bacterium]
SFSDRVNQRLEETAKGLLIENVEAAGWAALAGLRQGDILLKIDGVVVPDVTVLEKRMLKIVEAQAKRIIFFVKRGIHTLFVRLEPDWEDDP